MRIDFIAHPELSERYSVMDLEASEQIENVAWADDDAGCYAVFKMRPLRLSDRKGADTRMRDSGGGFVLSERVGDIQIKDMARNPFKGDLLALLDDPDVLAKLKAVLDDGDR